MVSTEALEPKNRWRPRMVGPYGRSIYRKEPYDLSLKSGDKITIRPRTYDAVVVHEIFRKKTYEPSFEIDRPKTILDLGANIGLFAVWAGLRYSPEEIIAVEPVRQNHDLLNKNLGRLATPVKVVPTAVTGDGRQVDMKLHKVNISGAHVVAGGMESDYSIQSQTLTEIVHNTTAGQIDFLKIDIEGTEGELFNDKNKEFFADAVGYVIMEIDRRSSLSPEETVSYFDKLGYETNRSNQYALNARGYFEALNTNK